MVTNRAWQEIIWIAPKKFQKLLRRLAPLTFLIRVQAFGTHFAESFGMSKSSWMMDPTRSREMPSSSAIDLAEIWRSSKISYWIWSIISGVVIVLGLPGRGASHVESHITTFKLGHSFWRWHTMMNIPLMFPSERREFPSAPCLAGKKLHDSSRLDVVEIARVAWNASFQPL